jgi:hypothetical protein
MVQCDAESNRRTLTEKRRISIPGRSNNISIMVQAIDSIFLTPEVEKNLCSLFDIPRFWF